jgi:peptidoglycan/xylan/chitin deacetylase (PgdA/CDA1 family)
MRLPGGKLASESGQWLLGKMVGHALILGYHRVSDGPDPYRLAVSPERFAEHLAVLARMARPLPVGELPELLAAGQVPKRTVALTFDDGYADVLHLGKPLLTQFGIPATVFVTSGALGRELWWDRLDRLAGAASGGRPIDLPIGQSGFTWTAKGLTGAGPELREALYPILRALDQTARDAVLDRLAELVGISSGTGQVGLRRVVDADEMRELADGNLVDIGAHTVTHPALSQLSTECQREEIAGSRRQLEAALGRPVTGFSYPFGDTGARGPTILQEEGFLYACESRNGVAWRRTDQFALPRFWVPNWDGRRFAGWLEQWLDD